MPPGLGGPLPGPTIVAKAIEMPGVTPLPAALPAIAETKQKSNPTPRNDKVENLFPDEIKLVSPGLSDETKRNEVELKPVREPQTPAPLAMPSKPVENRSEHKRVVEVK